MPPVRAGRLEPDRPARGIRRSRTTAASTASSSIPTTASSAASSTRAACARPSTPPSSLAWTEVTLGPDLVGWSDKAHGGILATLLDELMGWALFEHDCWGVTAELTVRYLRPADVNRRLRVEGEVVEASRRLFRTRGRILDEDGSVLATAEGALRRRARGPQGRAAGRLSLPHGRRRRRRVRPRPQEAS